MPWSHACVEQGLEKWIGTVHSSIQPTNSPIHPHIQPSSPPSCTYMHAFIHAHPSSTHPVIQPSIIQPSSRPSSPPMHPFMPYMHACVTESQYSQIARFITFHPPIHTQTHSHTYLMAIFVELKHIVWSCGSLKHIVWSHVWALSCGAPTWSASQ